MKNNTLLKLNVLHWKKAIWLIEYLNLGYRFRLLHGVVSLLTWLILNCLFYLHCPGQIKHYQHFDVSDGLLSNRLTSIVEGPDGYIWITSDGAGICRFDGLVFEHFNDRDSIGTSYYYSSLADESGLWFGGENYLLNVLDDQFQVFPIAGVGSIRQILTYNDSILLCLADETAFYFEKSSQMVNPLIIPKVNINQIAQFQETIWAATTGGVWKKMDDNWQRIYPFDSNHVSNCIALLKTPDGGLLMVDEKNGLIKIDEDNIEVLLDAGQLPSLNISFIKAGDLGDIYFGTRDKGIQILQPLDSLWIHIGENQLQFNHVTSMIFDQWENAWVTTDGGGLTKFYTESYNLYKSPDLSGRYIRQIEKWQDTLFINYQNGRWDQIINEQIVPVSVNTLQNEKMIAFSFDNESKWFASETRIFLFKDTFVYEIDSGILERIYDLEVFDSTQVMVATNRGLQMVSFQTYDSTSILKSAPLSDATIKSIGKSDEDNLWFFGDHIIGTYQDSTLFIEPISYKPSCLISFENGTMLLGTRDDGLFLIDLESEKIKLTAVSSTAVSLKNIRSMAIDRMGYLWIASQNQVAQYRRRNSEAPQLIKTYDQNSGLPRLEFYENMMQSGPDDKIYLGTSGGLLEIISQSSLQSARGPVISLMHFSTLEDRIRVLNVNTRNWLQTILPKEADINILFKAIDQRSPEPIQYLYQLQPKDKDWIATHAGGNFQFYALPPGRYNFLVMARNRDGKLSDTIEIPFRILTPFYQQWWFVLFLVFSIGVTIYGFYRWRLNVQLKKNRQVTESLKTQNKILRLEQAAGRLQMNPHFIFNALQSIQSSINEGDRDKARKDLQVFSKLMRGYLDHARAEKIMLEDEINLLDQYLSVERDLKGHCFDYEIHVPETIDPTFIEIPAMLLQPFVENAVKHGLPANGIKGLIKVEFDWRGKYLCCTISDNGPGFHSKKSSGSHQSAGMEITRERLQAFFKNTSLNPLLIKSESGNQNDRTGTEIQVLLPTEF